MSTKAEAVALEDVEIEAVDPSDEAEVESTREIGAAELKSIAEALIFVADEPISPVQLRSGVLPPQHRYLLAQH